MIEYKIFGAQNREAMEAQLNETSKDGWALVYYTVLSSRTFSALVSREKE